MSITMIEEPCNKKPKLEDYSEKYEVLLNYINQINNSPKKLKAVVSDDLTNPIQMTQMYAGSIKSRKDISKAIKILNEKLPLDGFGHLKRVRNDTILICPTETIKNEFIEDYIKLNVPELIDLVEKFYQVPAPKYPPKLKKQCAEISKTWSCNFHPDAYLEKLTGDQFFSDKEADLHYLYMTFVLKVALWYFKSIKIEKITEETFANTNVTVIVDPSINSVVAIGVDNRSLHPIQHSAMLAIDNVAKTQNGGAWNCNNKGTDNNYTLDGIDKELLNYLSEESPEIKIGAKKYFSKQDLIDDVDKTTADGPYLCTNYYVYTLREPCLMCSMGLVHARAKRVFYCFDKPESGALKSKTKLHTVSSLNHHYEVFTGFL